MATTPRRPNNLEETEFTQIIDNEHKVPQAPVSSPSSRKKRAWIVAGTASVVIVAVIALSVCLTHNNSKHTSSFSSSDRKSSHTARNATATTRNLLQFCNEQYLQQPLDHSQPSAGNYQQRYFVCSQDPTRKNQTIFFYAGNEANMELYLNDTGLMWENANEFKAVSVFAEHRFFGKSRPAIFKLPSFNSSSSSNSTDPRATYLFTDQALADYVAVIKSVKQDLILEKAPVIAFGGSYGGELAYWFRLKYPEVAQGAIAASAPILGALGDKNHPVDAEGFARMVMYDASPQAGANQNCVPALRHAMHRIPDLMNDTRQTHAVQRLFGGYPSVFLRKPDFLTNMLSSALGNMAMGNFPFASSYITGHRVLPAFPMRVACSFFDRIKVKNSTEEDTALLEAVAKTLDMCFGPAASSGSGFGDDDEEGDDDETMLNERAWGALVCNEVFHASASDDVHDFFGVFTLEESIASTRARCGSRFDPEAIYTRNTEATMHSKPPATLCLATGNMIRGCQRECSRMCLTLSWL